MNKVVIELRCQRVPKKTVYNGAIAAYSDPSTYTGSCCVLFDIKFKERNLEDVGESIHYFARFVGSVNIEFCIRMLQKAPTSDRHPVEINFTPEQVSLIYAGPEEARKFFAPVEYLPQASACDTNQKGK